MVDRKVVASGLYEGLARADIELRRKRRGAFRKVDRIKRDPCWMPWWNRQHVGGTANFTKGTMMDDARKQQLLDDAEALDRAAETAAFFAEGSEDESAAEQARHDENCLKRWAAFNRELTNG